MPTYSLTLRQSLGRKLTAQELDNNWLYLQQLALSATVSTGPQGATGPQGPTGGSATIGSEFEQTNITSSFKLINKTSIFDTTINGTLSFAGSYFTNSTSSLFVGISDATLVGGGVDSSVSYIGTSGDLIQLSVNDIESTLSAYNTTSLSGTTLTIATQGSGLSHFDINSGIQNTVIVGNTSTGILNLIATQSQIRFGSLTDPFNTPITQDFVTIDGLGNFESYNPNSNFSINNIHDDVSILGMTASFLGLYDNVSQFIGLIASSGITFSTISLDLGGGDEQAIRILPGIGIQLISDIGGTESHVYVNESKVDLSFSTNSQIELFDNQIRLTSSDLFVNGATGFSGTYSTADGKIAKVTNGIITSIV